MWFLFYILVMGLVVEFGDFVFQEVDEFSEWEFSFGFLEINGFMDWLIFCVRMNCFRSFIFVRFLVERIKIFYGLFYSISNKLEVNYEKKFRKIRIFIESILN